MKYEYGWMKIESLPEGAARLVGYRKPASYPDDPMEEALFLLDPSLQAQLRAEERGIDRWLRQQRLQSEGWNTRSAVLNRWIKEHWSEAVKVRPFSPRLRSPSVPVPTRLPS